LLIADTPETSGFILWYDKAVTLTEYFTSYGCECDYRDSDQSAKEGGQFMHNLEISYSYLKWERDDISSFLVSKCLTVYANVNGASYPLTSYLWKYMFSFQFTRTEKENPLKLKILHIPQSQNKLVTQNKDPQSQVIINFNNRGLLSLNSKQ